MYHKILLSLFGFLFLANSFNAADVASWGFGSWIFPDKNSSVKFDLKLFAPTKPGLYPVNIFLPGLDGFAGNFFYISFVEEIVEKAEVIVVVFDGLRTPKLPHKEELLFELAVNWTLKNIESLFNMKNTPSVIKGSVFADLKTKGISFMGHSASGHTLVSYLVKQCGLVTSLVLLDPVDGYDPFGIVKSFVTNPPAQLPFIIPTLIASTGLGSLPPFPGFPPCAPSKYSNYRFYDSLSGPTWHMNFTHYGHGDILSPFGRDLVAFICTYCKKDDCKIDLYRNTTADAVAYFLTAINNKNQVYLNAIEDPVKSSLFDPAIELTSEYKYQGYNVLQTGPFCKRLPTN